MYGRPVKNLGVMKWYGYTKSIVDKYDSAYTRRIETLIAKVLLERRKTVIERFKVAGNKIMMRILQWLPAFFWSRIPFIFIRMADP